MMDFGWIPDWLAQGAPKEGGGGGAGGGAPDGGGGLLGGLGFLLPIFIGLMVIYFMLMLKPQHKESTKTRQMLENLKKNDRVLTAGGMVGTIVNIRDDGKFVTLRIDESTNTKIQILRSAVIRVLADEDKTAES